MLLRRAEKNIYRMDDIRAGLYLSVAKPFVEFVLENENGFYFTYLNLQAFLEKLNGQIFEDIENDELINIDIDYYADLFRKLAQEN